MEQALDKGYTLVEHGVFAVMDDSVNIMGRVMDESEGQDKIFKIWFSFLKMCNYVVTELWIPAFPGTKATANDIVSRFSKCMAATRTSRMFLKLFHTAVFIRLFFRVLHAENFSKLKVLVLGRLFGLSTQFSFNVVLWLIHAGLLKTSSIIWDRVVLSGQIVAIIFSIMLDLLRILSNLEQRHQVLKKIRAPEVEVDKEEVWSLVANGNTSRNALSIISSRLHHQLQRSDDLLKGLSAGLFKDGCDLISAMDRVFSLGMSDLFTGVLDISSAFIGVVQLWHIHKRSLMHMAQQGSKKDKKADTNKKKAKKHKR